MDLTQSACRRRIRVFKTCTQLVLCSSSGVNTDTSQQDEPRLRFLEKSFLRRVYMLAASASSHSPNTCEWSGLDSWIALCRRCEVKCDCDWLLIIVRFAMDWQLVQGVSCLLPSAFWDTIQPVVQDLVTSNCIWNQHTSRLILFVGLILANAAHLFDYIDFKNNIYLSIWFYAFIGCQFVAFWRCSHVKGQCVEAFLHELYP